MQITALLKKEDPKAGTATNGKTTTNPLQLKLPVNNPLQLQAEEPKQNNTGLPDNLKAGVEALSGYSMDDVKVHYNSDKPTQLQALAYAQGTDIHIAPGQEQHLPHEAWHVVQQKQGRVQPTIQMKTGVAINDDAGLEQEADMMGAMALQTKPGKNAATPIQYKTGPQLHVTQMVRAYRVQYLYNKKAKGGTVTAPVDISFEFQDHSEYFLAERGEGQQLGLEVVSWDVNDDWYQALKVYAQIEKTNLNGKQQHIFERFKKQHLPIPSKSDGQDCPKFIRDRALHFQAAWDKELKKASSNFSVHDVEKEKFEEENEKQKKQFGEGATKDYKVWIQGPGEEPFEIDYSLYVEIYKAEGYEMVPEPEDF